MRDPDTMSPEERAEHQAAVKRWEQSRRYCQHVWEFNPMSAERECSKCGSHSAGGKL